MLNLFEIKRVAHNEAYIYYQNTVDPSVVLAMGADGYLRANEPHGTDDSLDAFRHAYVSGVFTMEYTQTFANILGIGNELLGDIAGNSEASRAMDLFNNAVGRDIAASVSSRTGLASALEAELANGGLITSLEDASPAYSVDIELSSADGFTVRLAIVDTAFTEYLVIDASMSISLPYIMQAVVDNFPRLTEQVTVNINQGSNSQDYHVYGGTDGADIVSFAPIVNFALLGDGDDGVGMNTTNTFADGGDGIDTISYANAAGSLIINLGTGQTRFPAFNALKDTIVNFENVEGTWTHDTITGSSGDNSIIGGGGVDTIQFNGSFGHDTVSGGERIVVDGGNIGGIAQRSAGETVWQLDGQDVSTISGGLQIGSGANSITLTDWVESGRNYGITLNSAPEVTTPIANWNGTFGDALTITIPPSTFSDADADALSFYTTRSDGSTLPSWLHFNPQTLTFTGTPQGEGKDVYYITVSADDGQGGEPASDTFKLVIDEDPNNDGPTAADGDDKPVSQDPPVRPALPGTPADEGGYTGTGMAWYRVDHWYTVRSVGLEVASGQAIGSVGGSVPFSDWFSAEDLAFMNNSSYEAWNGFTPTRPLSYHSDGPALGETGTYEYYTVLRGSLDPQITGQYNATGGLIIEAHDRVTQVVYGPGLAYPNVPSSALQGGITNFSVNAVNITGGTYSFGYNTYHWLYGAVDLSEGISANSLNDRLVANSSGDTLEGDLGNDTLVSGHGSDLLVGGAGADTFEFDQTWGHDTATGGEAITIGGQVIAGEAVFNSTSQAYQLGGFAISQSGAGLNVSSGGSSLLITDWSITNTYGITLGDTVPPGQTISGTSGGDTLTGGAGDDTITGGNGADSILGGAGNDSIVAGNTSTSDGKDTVYGGDGNDFISGDYHHDKLYGDAGNDTLDGGLHDDTLDGGDGNDLLLGGDGNDSLIGGAGVDTFDGGAGNDIIAISDEDYHVVQGGTGSDSITGSNLADTIIAGDTSFSDAQDTVYGGGGSDSLFGGFGHDQLFGGDGNDTLDGGGSDDTLTGGDGDDLLLGGDGNDRFVGGAGVDTFDGGAGNDIITLSDEDYRLVYGGIGADSITGTSLGDTLIGGDNSGVDGMDTLYGGLGNDSLEGGFNHDQLFGGDGNDTLDGGGSNDTLNGGDGDDLLLGGDGNDSFIGGAGVDTFDGGAGNDVIILSDEDYHVVLGGIGADSIIGSSLADTLDGGGTSNVDTQDTIFGAGGNDSIMGGFHNDSLMGGDGDDTILGGQQNDTLIGDAGNDLLTGGADADTFRFIGGAGFGSDTISDFLKGTDKISFVGVAGITSTSDVLSAVTYGAGAATITLSEGIITLNGITSGLVATDFVVA